MFKQYYIWKESRQVKALGFTRKQWESAVEDWPVMDRYVGIEREALFSTALRFLVRKNFIPGDGFQFTDAMCLKIATMACVPILHLGLDWYDHLHTIILYEGDFVPNRPYRGEDGVIHSRGPGLSGEAWQKGPLILSWDAVVKTGVHARHGHASNVVVHEFAHKLDMLRDGANGSPPMHPDMNAGEWHTIFTKAWNRLEKDWAKHQPLPLDEYALTNPAEFFAVCSETFFEAPDQIKEKMPDVYRLLCQFYRQDPG